MQIGISYCTAFRRSKNGKFQGRRIEGIDMSENDQEDLVQDFVSIVTSFFTRLYGQRRSKRKTERLIAELNHSPAASVGKLGGHG